MVISPPVGHRLPARSRIRAKADFQKVFAHGKRRRTDHLQAVIHPSGAEWSRIGLAVSRKVGNAVVRNRLKRRLREIFRLHRELAPEMRDIIFIPRPGCSSISYDVLAEEARWLIGISVQDRARG
ncbi:MAG: ribonuclease P protein component [Planctomycetota bacterium]|nr:ribonuclease P protein component [Planctomycetota bacterium]